MSPTLVQSQKRYYAGIPSGVTPPKGYVFDLSGIFLILVNREGKKFFACQDGNHWNLTPRHTATLWDKIRTLGRFRIGDQYADTRVLIQVPA